MSPQQTHACENLIIEYKQVKMQFYIQLMILTFENMFQHTIVEGRQILDVALVANEDVDSLKRNGVDGIRCKPDIEKAYNHVKWNFFGFVLTISFLKRNEGG